MSTTALIHLKLSENTMTFFVSSDGTPSVILEEIKEVLSEIDKHNLNDVIGELAITLLLNPLYQYCDEQFITVDYEYTIYGIDKKIFVKYKDEENKKRTVLLKVV